LLPSFRALIFASMLIIFAAAAMMLTCRFISDATLPLLLPPPLRRCYVFSFALFAALFRFDAYRRHDCF